MRCAIGLVQKEAQTMPDRPDSRDRWFHPLITTIDPRLNRRRLFAIGSGGLAATVVARPRLRVVAAQEATPRATAIADLLTGEPDAVALLRQAAQVMADLDTFGFEIETTRGQSTIFQGLEVDAITGAVRRPVDFTATVSVGLPVGSIDVTAIGIDGKAYIQDPLSDGAWTQLAGTEQLVVLVNPDTLILASIGLIQEAKIDGNEKVDGVQTTLVAGTLDLAASADKLSGGQFQLPDQVSSEPLDLLIWIDDQKRVVEIEIDGPLLVSESEDVIRDVRFFEFNEPVDIQAPAV